MSNKTISSALISVFSKDGLEPIVKKLNELNVTIYSTGGTEKFIKDLELPERVKDELLDLTPFTYVGNADKMAKTV